MALLVAQGVYYFATGIWPLVSIEAFEMVTGPKTDHWLVRTVGILITVDALVLLVAAWRRRVPIEVVLLATGKALVLAIVDVVYVAGRVIAPIYLADAGAELVLIVFWGFALSRADVA